MKESISFGYHKYEFEDEGIIVELKRFNTERHNLYAYVTVQVDLQKYPHMERKHILMERQNLSSGRSKNDLVKTLSSRIDLENWQGIVETVCYRSIQRHWEGADPILIGERPKRTEIPYLLYPVIRKDAPCILYGPSGIGKSYVTLYLSALVQHNISVGPFIPQQANVLYLDWESGEDDLNERLQALNKGLEIETQMYYRYCHLPMVDDTETIRQLIVEYDIGLIVVDSKGAAMGGNINEAKETMGLFNAIRSFGVTSLIIDHVAKEKNSGPIGSVYSVNEARNVWEMMANNSQTMGERGISRIGLYHRKTNVGKRYGDIGLEFGFTNDDNLIIDKVTVNECDVKDDPVTRKGASVVEQIIGVLKANISHDFDGTGHYQTMTSEEIAETLDIKLNTIRTRLAELRGVGVKRKGLGWIYDPEGDK